MRKFIVFALLLVCATTALAAEPTAPTASAALADFLRVSVFPIIGSLFLGLLSLALNKLGQKWKIDALTQKNNILMQIAGQGVAFAEERAATLIGSKAEITGNDKMDAAVAYITSALPKISKEEAQRAATAVLAMIPGVGATGAAAVAFPTGGSAAPADA